MTDISNILKARALQLAAPLGKEEDKEEQLCLLEFRINDERYGLEVQFTKEISHLSEFTSLPETPDFVLGVMNLRQRIISIVDLKKILNIPENESSKKENPIIVIEKDGLEFALLVDEVMGTRIINKDTIQSPPSTFSGLQKELLMGVTKQKLIVLNGNSFFQRKEFIVHKEVESSKKG